MSQYKSLEDVLTAVSMILLASFGLGMLALLLWFICFLIGGDFIHQVHAKMFDVSRNEFDLVNYCGMGLVKLGSLMLFLFPWIGTRLVLRGMKNRSAAAMP